MNTKRDDEMDGAFVKLDPNLKIGSMIKTGIHLKATDRKTGKPASSGVQLNNTTMEIESIPEVMVEIVFPDINDAQHPARQKAIAILEAISEQYGNEDMFDNESHQHDIEPDGTWYNYEDLVTGIIAGEKE